MQRGKYSCGSYMESKFNLAVLIDGDNAQAKLIKEILEEVSRYGKATIRRIYGDWTTPQMNSWKDLINQYSINPIQKFSYTTGKNSTDSAMIIDAMDILHADSVDGFCIVSSDSDYTGLAKRIREEGMFVMGIGERKTPTAFVKSCEIFTFSENLQPKSEKSTSSKGTTRKNTKRSSASDKSEQKQSTSKLGSEELKLLDKAFEISTNTNEEEEVYIAHIGTTLRKIDPSFDPRSYGFRTLTQLFASIDKYKIMRNVVNGLNQPLVKLK